MRFVHLALAAFIAAAPLAVLADEIQYLAEDRDPLSNVEVTAINFKHVTYKFLDEDKRAAGEQKEEMKKVRDVVFEIKPPDYESAEAYEEKGNYPAAAQGFRRAMADRSRNGWVDQYCLFRIAKCHLAVGDTAKAAETYAELLKSFPDTVHLAEARLALAELSMAVGKMKEAKKSLEELAQTVKQNNLNKAWGYQANLALFRIVEAEGDLEAAKKGYRQLADEAENEAKDVHFRAKLGYARCILPSDQNEAFKNFEALSKSEEVTDPDVLAGAWNGLAVCYYEKKDFKPALLAALHVVTMYEAASEEMPLALFCAAACFYHLRDQGKDDANWEARAADLYARLHSEYGSSSWARLPYKTTPTLLKK